MQSDNGPTYDISPPTQTPASPPSPYVPPSPYPPHAPQSYPPPPPIQSAPKAPLGWPWTKPMAALMALLGVGLIVSGIVGAVREINTRSPITLQCGDFLKKPVDHGWYHLSNCSIDLTHALTYTVRATSGISSILNPAGKLKDVYIPVYASVDDETPHTALLLHTQDRDILNLVDRLRKMDQNDEKKMKAFVKAHINELLIEKDITGTISTETDKPEASHEDLLQLASGELKPDYVILDEGATPIPIIPSVLIAFGFMSLAVGTLIWLVQWSSVPQRKPVT